MNRLSRIFLSLLVLPLLGLGQASADATQDLRRFFNEINSYSASFEQVVYDESGKEIDRSTGRLWIERPGRFRWEYSQPSEQIIVGTGDSIWIYDVELEQATQRSSALALSRTPAALLAGEGDLDASFDISDLGNQDGLDRVAMHPRDEEAGFRAIHIGFTDGQLVMLELFDAFDQTTRMQFKDMQENVGIPDSTFTFSPPEEVDVIVE